MNLNQGGMNYSYLYDGKGNVTALIDSSQNVVATYTYDPFGVLMQKTGTLNQPYMFSTKEYDLETGLSYYGYRFYSPAIERWITRDPIEEAGGINLYGFAENSPPNFSDPEGLFIKDCTLCFYYMIQCAREGLKCKKRLECESEYDGYVPSEKSVNECYFSTPEYKKKFEHCGKCKPKPKIT